MAKKTREDVVDLCSDDDSSLSHNHLSRRNLFPENPSIQKSKRSHMGRKLRGCEQSAEKQCHEAVISLLSSSDEEEFLCDNAASSSIGEVVMKRKMSRSPVCPTAKPTKSLCKDEDGSSDDDTDSLELTRPGPFQDRTSPYIEPISVATSTCVDMVYKLNIATSGLNNPQVASETRLGAEDAVSSTVNHTVIDLENYVSYNTKSQYNTCAVPQEVESSSPAADWEQDVPSASSFTVEGTGSVRNGGSADDTMIPTPRIPKLATKEGNYPDLRHTFIRALIQHAIKARTAASLRPVFDAAVRAVIVLSVVRDYPIRTSYACSNIHGIGKELLVVLQGAETERPYYFPSPSKFSTIAPAVLVALLNYEQMHILNHSEGDSCPTPYPCPIEDLFTHVNQFLDPAEVILNQPLDVYLDKNNLDPHWAQVKKLCSENISAGICSLLKERRNKKKSPQYGIVYELTETGRDIAVRLRKGLSSDSSPRFGPLRQLPSAFVEKKYKSVTLCVDHREGGGGSKSLHTLCENLDQLKVPYFVSELKIADYVFFVNNKLAPVLIERKSAEDVAGSLSDGRWERQQRNMRKALYILGGGEARRGHICYLIEGDASRRTVHGGNVGRRSWDQSVVDVENAIASLPKLGFSVIRSTSSMDSMTVLAQVAVEVSWRYHNGSLDCNYTYDEFIHLLRRCDEQKGDPPTSAEHQNPTPLILDHRATRNSSSQERKVKDQNNANIEAFDAEGFTEAELIKLPKVELQTLLKERFEPISGTREELIQRLLLPRRPEILITRLRHKQYVPQIPSCNAALMVALLLNWKEDAEGLTKEALMMRAQETGIQDMSRPPGSYYDGFSGIKELISGDPPLVNHSKKRYTLTTRPTGSAGIDVARALHIHAHRRQFCRCGRDPLDKALPLPK